MILFSAVGISIKFKDRTLVLYGIFIDSHAVYWVILKKNIIKIILLLVDLMYNSIVI